MSWTPILPADLEDAKVAALVTALRSAALGENQTDPAERIIAGVVVRIRTEVAGCPQNRLDADESKIPGSLKDLALRMVVRQMMSRLKKALSEDERTEQANDLKYLERISKCGVPIETPDNPITPPVESASGGFEVVRKPQSIDRCDMEGLL